MAVFDLPVRFEIPDAWLRAARVESFKPTARAFAASPDPEFPTQLLRLADVAPPWRAPGVPWFDEPRMVRILRGFRDGDLLPPIRVDEPPVATLFRFHVREGFHRYYASAAVGFPDL